MSNELPKYKLQIIGVIFWFFGGIIWAIGAATTFSFFQSFFPVIIPKSFMTVEASSIVSGIMGVVVFDLSSVVWLTVFLNSSETSQQRAVSIITTIVTFICAASASTAYFILNGTGLANFGGDFLNLVGVFSLFIVVVGFVLNVGSTMAFARFSSESIRSVRVANRQNLIQKRKEIAQNLLDKETQAEFAKLVKKEGEGLAKLQAEMLRKQFVSEESEGYKKDSTETSPQNPTNHVWIEASPQPPKLQQPKTATMPPQQLPKNKTSKQQKLGVTKQPLGKEGADI